MTTDTPTAAKTTDELIGDMWDKSFEAWLGTSAGLMMIVSAAFWRFAMRPWTVLIDYGDGHIVWFQHGRNVPTFTGPIPPPIPMEHNLYPLAIAILGIAIIWLANIRRNAVVRELRRRREVAR